MITLLLLIMLGLSLLCGSLLVAAAVVAARARAYAPPIIEPPSQSAHYVGTAYIDTAETETAEIEAVVSKRVQDAGSDLLEDTSTDAAHRNTAVDQHATSGMEHARHSAQESSVSPPESTSATDVQQTEERTKS